VNPQTPRHNTEEREDKMKKFYEYTYDDGWKRIAKHSSKSDPCGCDPTGIRVAGIPRGWKIYEQFATLDGCMVKIYSPRGE